MARLPFIESLLRNSTIYLEATGKGGGEKKGLVLCETEVATASSV